MAKHRDGRETGRELAPPILVTEWGDIDVDGGVLLVTFWSGPQCFTLAAGPAIAFKGIDRARKALRRGCIERLIGVEAH